MQIYWIKAQAPRRVLALVKHLGLAADFIEVDLMGGGLKAPAYAALNPNLKAPTLVDGDMVLWESSAIMAYLCIKAGSDMWPAHNPAEQVQVLQWLSWCDHHWSPAVGPFYFEHVVKATFRFAETDRSALVGKDKELQKLAKVLDDHLAGRDYLACGRLTIADFQVASMANYWRESEMPFDGFPNLTAWLERLKQIPAWADPWPADGQVAA
ncbi:glutathione S-transferase [Caulobacter ginsengisoli]|uniref:Glutathione S-transferase n=1 Tax=Caulobacter ginsengisoli TaxID=400775 RepID=A0ABU0IMW5_9CAUL|nr:glutathione S-transferase family protein [Caulobacter ginsengisoli]MDQ0462736.1 glutathione S-transferase [Caulobacter ginsengisoli]